MNIISDDEQLQANARSYQWGHLAMTYTGIGILATLGDDLSRIDRKSIVDGKFIYAQLISIKHQNYTIFQVLPRYSVQMVVSALAWTAVKTTCASFFVQLPYVICWTIGVM